MSRFRSVLRCCAGALASAALASPATAQFAKPEDAVKYRKAAMTMQATHFGRIAAMAAGRAPFDAKAAADNAEVVAIVSKWQFTGFVEGSDKGDTRAKPEVWTEAPKFQDAARKSQEAVDKLGMAVRTGNLDAITAAVGPVGQTCNACHDSFRKD